MNPTSVTLNFSVYPTALMRKQPLCRGAALAGGSKRSFTTIFWSTLRSTINLVIRLVSSRFLHKSESYMAWVNLKADLLLVASATPLLACEQVTSWHLRGNLSRFLIVNSLHSPSKASDWSARWLRVCNDLPKKRMIRDVATFMLEDCCTSLLTVALHKSSPDALDSDLILLDSDLIAASWCCCQRWVIAI